MPAGIRSAVPGIARISIVIALVLSLGLHWAFLQAVAWSGMIVNYSRDASLSEAVGMTFDGQHPCGMCKVIQKAKNAKSERENQFVPKGKLDLGLIWTGLAFLSAQKPEPLFAPPSELSPRAESPLKPPPRAA